MQSINGRPREYYYPTPVSTEKVQPQQEAQNAHAYHTQPYTFRRSPLNGQDSPLRTVQPHHQPGHPADQPYHAPAQMQRDLRHSPQSHGSYHVHRIPSARSPHSRSAHPDVSSGYWNRQDPRAEQQHRPRLAIHPYAPSIEDPRYYSATPTRLDLSYIQEGHGRFSPSSMISAGGIKAPRKRGKRCASGSVPEPASLTPSQLMTCNYRC